MSALRSSPPRYARAPHPRRESQAGVALLMVMTAVAVLTIVLVDFSRSAITHMNEGAYVRDEVRANAVADTALDLTRACLDRAAWGPFGAMQGKVNLERVCNLLLGIFIRGQVDLPVGGLSVPLEGMGGLKLDVAEVDEVVIQPESSFIGLVGLACVPPNMALIESQQEVQQQAQAAQASGQSAAAGVAAAFDPLNCPSRLTTVKKLRSLLCDPAVAHVFETEQPDGQRYTREEVIGNLVDWIDADDNRVSIDPFTWRLQEGAGEGEDSYYRDMDDRYRSKDSMFDSVEELRLVRGVSDELYFFLRDRVSVYATDKVNVNTASAEVISALLQAHTARFQQTEAFVCGEESPTADLGRDLFGRYARMITDARATVQINKVLTGNILGQVFPNPNEFIRVAQDPLTYLVSGGVGQMVDPLMVLMTRYQMSEMQYQFIKTDVQWPQMVGALGAQDQLFRLKVRGHLGEMTKTLTAVLKQDGPVVRTLYYRED
jgi:hypothetical protein